jgi:predicted RNase H-like nuclease (RuvC/YqgF family)
VDNARNDPILDVLRRIEDHGASLARHEAEIHALKDGQERMDTMMGDLRNELREARAELREDMRRGFDDLGADLKQLAGSARRDVSPEVARELASTRAAEGRARAYTLALLSAFLVALGVIARLVTGH